ncbi:MAG TPA: hypothetical protein PKN48_09295 [Bacteroidales bacterium]|nr:hypothetical protein [Bacteroidales bacterium]
MMKKISLIILAAIVALPAFQSCKKGENDPALSLRSRKARLCGEWVLKEGMETIVKSNGDTEVNTYNGTTCTKESTGNPAVTRNYSIQVTFNKDNSFKKTRFDGNDQYIDEGIWYFGSRSKELELKNKESVCFVTNLYTYSIDGNPTQQIDMQGTNAISYPAVWLIDRLSSKELIILTDGVYSTGSGSMTTTGTMTYEKL